MMRMKLKKQTLLLHFINYKNPSFIRKEGIGLLDLRNKQLQASYL